MNSGRQFVVCALALGLVWTVGCAKKKPQLPPQAQGPVATESVPLPYEISETAPPPPPPPPKEEPVAQEPPKPPPQKHRKKKPATTPPASTAQGSTGASTATSTTASNPAATPPPANTTIASAHTPPNPAVETPPDTAIAADVSSAQLNQQKQTTAQLLDATEKTLNGLSRTLPHDEEEMVVQVRSYIAQSRKATTDGDFERAYNLATKAHLLADALVKK
jgi:protein TonB